MIWSIKISINIDYLTSFLIAHASSRIAVTLIVILASIPVHSSFRRLHHHIIVSSVLASEHSCYTQASFVLNLALLLILSSLDVGPSFFMSLCS